MTKLLGVQIVDNNGHYRSPNDILKDLSEVWDKINYDKKDLKEKTMNKPPLGVMPKKFYELRRIQDLTRVLYEYSNYANIEDNYEVMVRWSEELTERLSNLKFEKDYKENNIN